MRKKRDQPERQAARAPRRPARKPVGRAAAGSKAAKPKVKKYTSEENRGGQFFSAVKMWRLLHADRGRTIFNKQMLAERFFADVADEEDPGPEFMRGAVADEFRADLAADVDDDTGVFGTRTATRYNRIREKHKRFVQRKIETLQKQGLDIDDVDEEGNKLDEDGLIERRRLNPSAERLYRYDPNGAWATELDSLLDVRGVIGTDLVGLMAMSELIEDMKGTPLHKSLKGLLDRIIRCVPPQLGAAAREQARVYRHSLGCTAKYAPKVDDLERWYAAILQYRQAVIDYTTPGEACRPRQVAALSTMFHREENSLYLLGSEKTAAGWGPIRQWKFDRVRAVRPLNVKNPRLADLPKHPLVRPAAHAGSIELLDSDNVYGYSTGAWLETDTAPQRLEVLVRVPAVGRPGMEETARKRLQRAARRRAYGWMEWCREKPFHPRQVATLETTASGEKQLRLVVEKCYVAEMASRLLRLQDCFEVVAPQELAVLIRDYAGAISTCHGPRP